MSTTTTQTPSTPAGFLSDVAPVLPQRACIGAIADIGAPKVSASQKYVVQNVRLNPTRGAGRVAFVNLLWRPEWFTPGFNPQANKDSEAAEKMIKVYNNNIFWAGRTSNLQGLLVNDANWQAFLSSREAAFAGQSGDLSMEEIGELLREALSHGDEVGYLLQQASEKTGEIDASGNDVYQLVNKYEVKGYFNPDDPKAITRLTKRAENSDGSFIVTFEV